MHGENNTKNMVSRQNMKWKWAGKIWFKIGCDLIWWIGLSQINVNNSKKGVGRCYKIQADGGMYWAPQTQKWWKWLTEWLGLSLPASPLTLLRKMAGKVVNGDHVTTVLWDIVITSWVPECPDCDHIAAGSYNDQNFMDQFFSAALTLNIYWTNGYKATATCILSITFISFKT